MYKICLTLERLQDSRPIYKNQLHLCKRKTNSWKKENEKLNITYLSIKKIKILKDKDNERF